MTFIMILSMLGGAGAAERGAVAAEHTRLTEEMRSKATVSRWDAVDDHYRELRALRGAKLRYEDHWMGAQAASALGDIQSTWRRLRRALDVEFTDEALGWWVTLTAQYGEVHLVAKPSVAQPITLTISLTISLVKHLVRWSFVGALSRRMPTDKRLVWSRCER